MIQKIKFSRKEKKLFFYSTEVFRQIIEKIID